MITTNSFSQHSDGVTHAIAATTDSTLHAGRNAALDALDSLRSNSRQLRNALLDTRDGTLRYIRHDPTKAILIAAAAGIVILGLAALMSKRRQRD